MTALLLLAGFGACIIVLVLGIAVAVTWRALMEWKARQLPDKLALGIDVYRIRTDRWRRTWQAEWPECETAPRAWTRRGVVFKALKWRRREGSDES